MHLRDLGCTLLRRIILKTYSPSKRKIVLQETSPKFQKCWRMLNLTTRKSSFKLLLMQNLKLNRHQVLRSKHSCLTQALMELGLSALALPTGPAHLVTSSLRDPKPRCSPCTNGHHFLSIPEPAPSHLPRGPEPASGRRHGSS